jgi:glutamate-1-semialdehyde 2,1-aminomutase
MPKFTQSKSMMERAAKSLAGGVSSHFRLFGQPHPLAYDHAEGVYITDVDGNRYLDFTLSQGPMILGHSHPVLLQRVAEASAKGQLYAGQHLLEIEAAEQVCAVVPCADLVRFSLSGTESDQMALRVARAVTGRRKFIKFEGHYHGWLDSTAISIHPPLDEAGPRESPRPVPWTGGQTSSVLDEVIILPWNDLALLEKTIREHAADIAAVITEPIMCNTSCIQPRAGFLEGMRALCDEHEIVLIFDEVITGFRMALGGAQEALQVTPDLTVMGKACAGGYPVSILTGRKQFMDYVADGRAIHAGTLNSNNASMAAVVATLALLSADDNAAYRRLADNGQALMEGLRQAAKSSGHDVLIQGPGPAFHMGFSKAAGVHDYREAAVSYDGAKYARFELGMLNEGVRVIGRGIWYHSIVHSPADVTTAIDAATKVLKRM